jgi:hypothetical protein
MPMQVLSDGLFDSTQGWKFLSKTLGNLCQPVFRASDHHFNLKGSNAVI